MRTSTQRLIRRKKNYYGCEQLQCFRVIAVDWLKFKSGTWKADYHRTVESRMEITAKTMKMDTDHIIPLTRQ